MAGFVELTIEQGATYTTTVDVKDGTGTATNLSGYSGSAQLRKSYYSSTATDFKIGRAHV